MTDIPMDDRELEALRRHGFGVAYRMLGSVMEAEDVTQEALLRLTRQDEPIDEPAAWITTVVTRLSINVLRSARARREAYVGPWLPEPLLEDPAPGPATRAELADSLSFAMLALLASGDTDATQLDALMAEARDARGGRSTPPAAQEHSAAVQVWSVLTVDVVDGRIQTVRIVRNPDKLGHL